jgi:hypothetical protein
MSSRWYWWNLIEWSSVALATVIGTVTRPKLIAPLQMVRGTVDLPQIDPEQVQPMSRLRDRHDEAERAPAGLSTDSREAAALVEVGDAIERLPNDGRRGVVEVIAAAPARPSSWPTPGDGTAR